MSRLDTSGSVMMVEQALAFLDKCLPQQHLNHVQEIVFRAAWQGQSYLECAKTHGYSPEYVKAVGYKLWQSLSLRLQQQVTKNNVQSVLRQHLLAQTELLDTHIKSTNQEIAFENQIQVPCASIVERSFQPIHNWEEVVNISTFYGRITELETLEKWIEQERCRLIGIFGMGGIGKTSLACKLVKQMQEKFDFIYWQDLSDAPQIQDLLANMILFLSQGQETEVNLPKSVDERISRLVYYLRSSRCLVVLDNGESILGSSDSVCIFRQGYENYGILLRQLGQLHHQSTIVVASREKPREIELFEGKHLPVRSLKLNGLNELEGRAIFEEKGNSITSEDDWKLIVQHYGGNPWLLQIFASVVLNLFDSNFRKFIKFWKQCPLVFNEICVLLDSQFNRLSDLEKSVMYWLAINRQPVSLQELWNDLFLTQEKQKLPDILRSLERRSLIEKNVLGFTLQPVVMEYVTKRFVEEVCHEILAEKVSLIMSHALTKFAVKEPIQENQKQSILFLIAEQLISTVGSYQEIEHKLNQMFWKIREKVFVSRGYGVKNLMNLSSYLINLNDYDFSQLKILQEFQNVNSRTLEHTPILKKSNKATFNKAG
jgi:ABC-type dipeptide/oligopeptide/nickel transport system ATPase subunit